MPRQRSFDVLMFRLLIVSLFLSLSPVASATSSPEQVSQLLSDMSQALRERDYRGLFTYEFGGALQTLQVTHQVMEGVEQEHLEYLNGPSRRVERRGRDISCLSAGDQVLRGMLPALEGNFHGLNQHYHFYLRDEQRIAGRAAVVLQIVPRDEYRYGYTLSIDKETYLPLGAMTLGVNRRVLERLQFANLELIPSDDWVAEVESSARVKRATWGGCEPPIETLAWDLSWVPSGFVVAGSSVLPDVGELKLYTDGLSAFSVFVRPMGRGVAAQGKAQRGATVAYMQQQMFKGEPMTITVVGEIPARAAQRIADGIRQTSVKEVGHDH